MRKVYVNTEDEKDIVTLEEIKRRYADINGTTAGFDEYAAGGFMDGIVPEYSERLTFKVEGLEITGTKERIRELVPCISFEDAEPSGALADIVSEMEMVLGIK